jgi:carbon-monoxide dehydrogenase catalytic subunit
VGCNNPRTTQDKTHEFLVRELLKHDVLFVETGCGAIASGKYGHLLGEAMEMAGPGLKEVCEATGMPPVLHMGSCVDNTRILTVLSQVVEEGGLGDDISDVPAVGIAPEWMSEKALAIASYCAGSGAYVILGIRNVNEASEKVTEILSKGWEKKVGGKVEFIEEAEDMVTAILAHIDQKREALGLPVYEPDKFGRSGDWRMKELLQLNPEERAEALYGQPAGD